MLFLHYVSYSKSVMNGCILHITYYSDDLGESFNSLVDFSTHKVTHAFVHQTLVLPI